MTNAQLEKEIQKYIHVSRPEDSVLPKPKKRKIDRKKLEALAKRVHKIFELEKTYHDSNAS